MKSAYEEFGFFGAVVRLSVGILVVATLFALLAVSVAGCKPPDPSTGKLELEVEQPPIALEDTNLLHHEPAAGTVFEEGVFEEEAVDAHELDESVTEAIDAEEAKP